MITKNTIMYKQNLWTNNNNNNNDDDDDDDNNNNLLLLERFPINVSRICKSTN